MFLEFRNRLETSETGLTRDGDCVSAVVQKHSHRLAETFLNPFRPSQIEDRLLLTGNCIREVVVKLALRETL
jgi:hypothetical protein